MYADCALVTTTADKSSARLITIDGTAAIGNLNPTIMSNQRRLQTPTICILGIGCSRRGTPTGSLSSTAVAVKIPFEVTDGTDGLIDDGDTVEPLTAKYEGGAAGMYVTRKLRLKDQGVDDNSPGFSGRFTAKAVLTAIFGGPNTETVGDTTTRISNMISGDITNFEDGNKDLDIKVTLDTLNILVLLV